MNRKIATIAGPLFGLVLFLAALWTLHHELAGYRYRDLAAGARAIQTPRLLLALLLTCLNYFIMTGYDALAFRYIRRRLEYGKIAFASFIGYAFSNNIGLSLLAGSSVRYRLYTAWGLSLLEVTKMVIFYTLTLWLGLLFMGGLAFAAEPIALPAVLKLSFSTRPVGFVFLAIVCGYIAWSAVRHAPVRVLNRDIELPSPGLSAAQIALASLDWLLAGSVLYALLPDDHGLSFPHFMSIYLVAQTAGLISQVPGGLGVFETVFVLLLPPGIAAPHAVGGLLLYRAIYYLLPLIIAAAMLGAYEIAAVRTRLGGMVTVMEQTVSAIAPQVLSLLTFAGGALLLFSGATPALPARLEWLKDILPLPFLELSHFLGSLVGVALLLLARGIQRRLDAAYHLTAVLLGAGALLSLLKGLDYEEALILTVMLAALLPSRRIFYRRSSLLNQSFSAGWIMSIAAVLAGAAWLGFFSYRYVEYSQKLWWQFTLEGDAPRFLRAMVGVVTLAAIVGAARLLRPALLESPQGNGSALQRIRPIIAASADTSANLAFLGDKSILFSESGKSFIMYGIEGRSWIAMGDPVGPAEERKELVWRFREVCDRNGGWPVFYEVGKENLYLFIELGLTSLKIGEEATVVLPAFSLEGPRKKGLRTVHSHLLRDGAAFSVVPPSDVPGLLPELRKISDAWLASKNAREKRFSLGYFDETYLREFPLAVVRMSGGIIAFSNLWPGADRAEVSADLMRHVPAAPHGIMEFLFVELLLWARQQGYRRFNLGMAPLAGLEDRSLAPLWNRLGAQIFRHGEHFYNFKGLRQFKEHFDPEWDPKYLVLPRGFLLPRILANLATLISGGLMGAVGK